MWPGREKAGRASWRGDEKRVKKSDVVEEIDRAVEEPKASQASSGEERNHEGSSHKRWVQRVNDWVCQPQGKPWPQGCLHTMPVTQATDYECN